MTEPQIPKTEFKPKTVRSYVIRGGRATAGQKQAFESHWPQFGLRLEHGRLDTAAIFGREAALVVEIGFGMGDSLLKMVAEEPDKNFIGVEVHPPGVGRLINEAGKQGLSNLKVFMADATDVLQDCLEDLSIDRMQIYFPDPWHKKKHNKRRLIQSEFLKLVAPKLKVGGILHLATDWEPYAEHMMEALTASDLFSNTISDGGFSKRPAFRPITKFERRGAKLGHGVWDLLFSKL